MLKLYIAKMLRNQRIRKMLQENKFDKTPENM